MALVQFTLDPPPRARPVGTTTERPPTAGLDFATWNVKVYVGRRRELRKRPGCI